MDIKPAPIPSSRLRTSPSPFRRAARFLAAALVVTMFRAFAPWLRAEESMTTDALFHDTCARCHGPQGFGDGPDGQTLVTKPRNFHDCEIMAKDSNEFVFNEIKGGSASVGRSNDMPSWGEALTDDEVRSLIAYVRHFCPGKPGK
jgi:mono/diheme cytochrome c family protein